VSALYRGDVLYKTQWSRNEGMDESFGKEVKPSWYQPWPPSLYTGKKHIRTNMGVHWVIILEGSDIQYKEQFNHLSTALNITHHMTHIYQERQVSVLKVHKTENIHVIVYELMTALEKVSWQAVLNMIRQYCTTVFPCKCHASEWVQWYSGGSWVGQR
jgi:hypothetical protein